MNSKLFDLSGKVALITGGNGGIGLGIAKAVAAAGADVCIWGTNAEKNQAAVAELKKTGRNIAAFNCNVADEQAVETTFSKTLQAMGRVDSCFANAGVIGNTNSFLDITAAEWRRVMSVNLDGAFFTLRAAARHMVQRAQQGDSGGRLLVTASLAALSGAARNEHYGATKGAVVSMIKGLAVEFARYGITANAILPGWSETDMIHDHLESDKFVDSVLKRIPVRRWGKPEDYAGIAVYFMSAASSYHNGDAVLIDGGYINF